eukprot:COSAG01_NODE_14_length_41020_cov_40.702133_27_plen_267_part_00
MTNINEIEKELNLIGKLPKLRDINDLHKNLKCSLFPSIYNEDSKEDNKDYTRKIKEHLNEIIPLCINANINIKEKIDDCLTQLKKLREALLLDAKAIYEGDPAASDLAEVILCYPGFEAILSYRIAHIFYLEKCKYLPRILTELSHAKTGIDIHPGAKIGHSFCIDHGTSLVIGETAIIGNHVKVYQGVTLGAFSVSKKNKGKRHPTLEDDVTVYARSTILGGDTLIGKGAIIGGNAWIIKSVPKHATVYVSQPPNQTIKDKKNDK